MQLAFTAASLAVPSALALENIQIRFLQVLSRVFAHSSGSLPELIPTPTLTLTLSTTERFITMLALALGSEDLGLNPSPTLRPL